MAYKTIMLCLNEVAALPQLIEAGRTLGARFGAHIKGLYVIPAVTIYGAESYALSPVMFDGNRVFFKDRQAKVRDAFESAMKADGLNFDFQVVDSGEPDISYDIIANARAVDLVVMSAVPEKVEEPVEDDIVERITIGGGRPVLVIQGSSLAKLNFDDVVLGWDGSREASRAVFDSMPFLVKSKRTHICTVNAPADGTVPGASLAENLSRHGAKTETQKLVSEGRNAGEALLLAAKDYGAGLVVMGCYGHSRFSEMVFGGATRHVIGNLDRPVLLSH